MRNKDDWVLHGWHEEQLKRLEESLAHERQMRRQPEDRLKSVYDFLDTPVWQLLKPDLFVKKESA